MDKQNEKLAKESLEEAAPVGAPVDLNEAPASATVRVWIDGYGAMITMRSDKVGTVMERLAWVIKYAKEKGWKSSWKTEKEIGDTDEPIEEPIEKDIEEIIKITKPVCPKCGGEMVRRTNKKTGNQFWGCSKYPNCNGLVDSKK